MKTVAIITARGGSKRIPRKNIREFMGKPMIQYAIDAAVDSAIFDEVMVSTEDSEIAQIAVNLGASVPFMRSQENADDFAGTDDVIREVVAEYAKRERTFEVLCCIYPCAPFLTGDMLKQAFARFIETDSKALMPVCRYSNPVPRALVIDGAGHLAYREPENRHKRSQDLPPVYYDAGAFYFVKNSVFQERGKIVGDGTIPYEIDARLVQDIDTLDDWKMAELKFKLMNDD